MVFFSLHVNKTIKSNREIMKDFRGLFEYIKLKIRTEEKNVQTKRKKAIKLSNNKRETNCSSLQIGIVVINGRKRKT